MKKIFCPNCGTGYEYKDELVGCRLQCAECEHKFEFLEESDNSFVETCPKCGKGRRFDKNFPESQKITCTCGYRYTLAQKRVKIPDIKEKDSSVTENQEQASSLPISFYILLPIATLLIFFLLAWLSDRDRDIKQYFSLTQNQYDNFLAVIVGSAIVFVVLFLYVITSSKSAVSKGKNYIICPNQNCGYSGQGKGNGSDMGCLVILLLCLGIIPGIIYLLFCGNTGIICPKCGMRIR